MEGLALVTAAERLEMVARPSVVAIEQHQAFVGSRVEASEQVWMAREETTATKVVAKEAESMAVMAVQQETEEMAAAATHAVQL